MTSSLATGILGRIAGALVLLWLVVTLTFVLVRLAPGDAASLLVPPAAGPEAEARMRAELGLDQPLPVQYARWLGSFARGEMGTSWSRQRPVGEVIAEALPISLGLGAASLALTFLIGVPLGLLQAARRGRWSDHAITVATTAVYAAPAFWLALALIAVFTYGAAAWGLPAQMRLPAFGIRSPGAELEGWAAIADVVRHAILPVSILAAVGAAGIARYARATGVDLLRADWVRTARAKGATPSSVHLRHVLRNALPPLVVLFALSLPGLVAGSVFVESVFAWPGMGRTMLLAINSRDYPLVLGVTVVYGALVITANLAADAVLPLVDPRRRG